MLAEELVTRPRLSRCSEQDPSDIYSALAAMIVNTGWSVNFHNTAAPGIILTCSLVNVKFDYSQPNPRHRISVLLKSHVTHYIRVLFLFILSVR